MTEEEVYSYLAGRIIQRADMCILLERLEDVSQCLTCEVIDSVAWTMPTIYIHTDDMGTLSYYSALFMVSQEVYDWVKNEPVRISYKDILDYKTLMEL